MNLALVSENATKQGKAAIVCLVSEIEKSGGELSVAYFASEPDPDRFFFEQIKVFYGSIGINTVHYIELEEGYDEGYAMKCLSSSLVHLAGGDTYRFLYWLKQRGLDVILRDRAKRGLPIVGVSAGAMVMTPSIDTAPLCGDVNAIGLDDTSSLDIVPFLFSPHAGKNAQEMVEAAEIKSSENQRVVLCSDTDALVIKGAEVIEFGAPLWV